VRADVTDADSLDTAFSEVEDKLGPVEVVVANAGITRDMLLMRMSADDFDTVVDTNLGGAFRVVKRASTGMIKADLLEPLDHSKIPNMKNIAPEFIDDAPFDPGRKYSLPYTWLVIGIGYRKSKVKQVPDSWKYLFDSDEYKGRIAVMSDASELFRNCFKYLGKSINDDSPELIKEAEAMLIKQKPNIKAFHEDNGQDLLLSGEVDVVMEYNGDIAQIMTEDDDIDFIVPKEGAMKQQDTLAIPKGAPHPENALKFLNFIFEPEVGAEITKTILYPSPNAAAVALMPDSYKDNKVIFPPADVMAKCEYPRYLGPEFTRLLDEAMTRLRAA
jgi:spermidine/putrescine transport system substrate-binding protein